MRAAADADAAESGGAQGCVISRPHLSARAVWQVAFGVAMQKKRPPIELRKPFKGYAKVIVSCWQHDPPKRPAMPSVVEQLRALHVSVEAAISADRWVDSCTGRTAAPASKGDGAAASEAGADSSDGNEEECRSPTVASPQAAAASEQAK